MNILNLIFKTKFKKYKALNCKDISKIIILILSIAIFFKKNDISIYELIVIANFLTK